MEKRGQEKSAQETNTGTKSMDVHGGRIGIGRVLFYPLWCSQRSMVKGIELFI